MPRSSRKREPEAMIEDDEEEVQDEEMSEGEEEEDEEMEDSPVGSPSPNAKKDMHLRSGKRKRRRSAGTSGLTPEEEKTKQARSTGRKRAKKNETTEETTKPSIEVAETPAVSTKRARASTRGRVSFAATDQKAVAQAQDPEQSFAEEQVLPIPAPEDSNRRLFDGVPPSAQKVSTPDIPAKSPESKPPQRQPGTPPPEPVQVLEEEEELQPISRVGLVWWRILFMVILGFSSIVVRPACVAVANKIIPLQELKLPDLPPQSTEEDSEPLEVPLAVEQTVQSMNRMHERARKKKMLVERSHSDVQLTMEAIEATLQEKKQVLQRSVLLNEAEKALQNVLQGGATNLAAWEEARKQVHLTGRSLLNSDSLDLWQVEEAAQCEAVVIPDSLSATPEEDVDADPHLRMADLERETEAILARVQAEAQKLMDTPETSNAVRNWVRDNIAKAMRGNLAASKAVTALAGASREAPVVPQSGSGLSSEAIDDIVQERLEMERGDRTGEYDHASVYSGGRIIYGGKRGTSKSLVDSLPLLNRLLQLSQLRFYGFGPEAAITPTYPTNALGQCWSFQQIDLQEQLKQRSSNQSPDDHKRGNFGTLTISLASPIFARSVVIEHPPVGLTDQASSAIRAFRIVGYEDAEASTKAWPLGSFEYDIRDSYPLQEFELETEAFGDSVPAIQAITLAVDSNWGHDYSCLYRFRVHGEEE